MKSFNIIKASFIITLLFTTNLAFSQNPVNWTKEQLMEPSELAQALQTKKEVPVIISVGPGAVIPGSVATGPLKEASSLDKLKSELGSLNKDTAVVIYCGCCPFDHCPNVRPAIALLKELNFTNYKLLNLKQNVKTDWLDKGYPSMK